MLNSYLAFSFFILLFSLTTLLQLGVYREAQTIYRKVETISRKAAIICHREIKQYLE